MSRAPRPGRLGSRLDDRVPDLAARGRARAAARRRPRRCSPCRRRARPGAPATVSIAVRKRLGSSPSASPATMLARLRALDGEHRVVVQAIVERDVEALGVALEPREILLVVGRVGDGQVAVVAEPVGEEVVQDAPVLLAQHAVLRSVLGDLRHVVGEDPLQEGLGARAGRLDLAHVRDVEDARVGAHVEVLFLDRPRTGRASPSRRTARASRRPRHAGQTARSA